MTAIKKRQSTIWKQSIVNFVRDSSIRHHNQFFVGNSLSKDITEAYNVLAMEVNDEEIFEDVMQINSLKALGADDMQAILKSWQIDLRIFFLNNIAKKLIMLTHFFF